MGLTNAKLRLQSLKRVPDAARLLREIRVSGWFVAQHPSADA
jgi:hypothetical protein